MKRFEVDSEVEKTIASAERKIAANDVKEAYGKLKTADFQPNKDCTNG